MSNNHHIIYTTHYFTHKKTSDIHVLMTNMNNSWLKFTARKEKQSIRWIATVQRRCDENKDNIKENGTSHLINDEPAFGVPGTIHSRQPNSLETTTPLQDWKSA